MGRAPDRTYGYHKEAAQKFIIRKIRPSDNVAVKQLIRSVLTEIGGRGKGSPYNDPELSDMFEAYKQLPAAFFVITFENTVVGTIGIGPLHGMEAPGICELRKFYLLPETRGLGLGASLLQTCLKEARQLGYQRCYLETHTKLKQAVILYERNGFQRLSAPMGNTGHTAPNLWYIKTL